MQLSSQIAWILILSIPVACVSWTVTHEEIFREVREYLIEKSRRARTGFGRKFHHLFTCEYCFSHYVALAFVLFARFPALLPDWRGYVVSCLAVVWMANIYMTIYGRLRLDMKKERVEIMEREHHVPPQEARLDHRKASAPTRH